jgi:hypothetical protein
MSVARTVHGCGVVSGGDRQAGTAEAPTVPAGQRRKETLDAEVVVEFLGCVAEGLRGTPQKSAS